MPTNSSIVAETEKSNISKFSGYLWQIIRRVARFLAPKFSALSQAATEATTTLMSKKSDIHRNPGTVIAAVGVTTITTLGLNYIESRDNYRDIENKVFTPLPGDETTQNTEAENPLTVLTLRQKKILYPSIAITGLLGTAIGGFKSNYFISSALTELNLHPNLMLTNLFNISCGIIGGGAAFGVILTETHSAYDEIRKFLVGEETHKYPSRTNQYISYAIGGLFCFLDAAQDSLEDYMVIKKSLGIGDGSWWLVADGVASFINMGSQIFFIGPLAIYAASNVLGYPLYLKHAHYAISINNNDFFKNPLRYDEEKNTTETLDVKTEEFRVKFWAEQFATITSTLLSLIISAYTWSNNEDLIYSFIESVEDEFKFKKSANESFYDDLAAWSLIAASAYIGTIAFKQAIFPLTNKFSWKVADVVRKQYRNHFPLNEASNEKQRLLDPPSSSSTSSKIYGSSGGSFFAPPTNTPQVGVLVDVSEMTPTAPPKKSFGYCAIQ